MDVRDRSIARLKKSGRIPVFPLPNVVFFPHTTLPLHIFEPRYRQMTGDALASDRLIAIALLKPGWERGYFGNPEVFPVACAGLIENEAALPDGRFNVRLRGLIRVGIQGFIQDHPYRVATVRLLEEQNAGEGPGFEGEKRRLLAACASLLQEISGQPSMTPELDNDVPLATVVNTLCLNLEMDPAIKQQLLTLDDVRERCGALIDILNRKWRKIARRQAARRSPPAGGVH